MVRRVLVVVAVLCLGYGVRAQDAILTEYKGVPAFEGRQCVEYVRRFLQMQYAYDLPRLGAGERGSAKYVFERVNSGVIKGLIAYPNGGRMAPQGDDILCFTHPTQPGHVAIVSEVRGREVHIVEQNWSQTGRAVLQLERGPGSNWVRRGNSRYQVQGWCRLPQLEKPMVEHVPSVLLLDISDSLERDDVTNQIKDALRQFSRLLGPEQDNLVIAFADEPVVIVPPRQGPLSDRELAVAHLKLVFSGRTNVQSACERALSEMAPWPRGKIVLVTDGKETDGKVLTLLGRLKSRHIKVSTIAIGRNPRQDMLAQLAQETGGQAVIVDLLTMHAAMRLALQ